MRKTICLCLVLFAIIALPMQALAAEQGSLDPQSAMTVTKDYTKDITIYAKGMTGQLGLRLYATVTYNLATGKAVSVSNLRIERRGTSVNVNDWNSTLTYKLNSPKDEHVTVNASVYVHFAYQNKATGELEEYINDYSYEYVFNVNS